VAYLTAGLQHEMSVGEKAESLLYITNYYTLKKYLINEVCKG
jgi:hypothetical protein